MIAHHTPGPWVVEASEAEGAGPPDGFEPFGACGCCESPWINGKTREERDANARLIAAAPDLLAALQTMIAAVKEPEHFASALLDKDRDDLARVLAEQGRIEAAAVDAAMAAVRKATGGAA